MQKRLEFVLFFIKYLKNDNFHTAKFKTIFAANLLQRQDGVLLF